MLKKEITYVDFNDDTVTDTFYFNLSKPELLEMELEVDGGLAATLETIIKSNSGRDLIKHFKKIILASYGVRTDDGKRFIKNDTLREEFSQTAAFHQLFIELSTNSAAAADFIIGIMPKDMAEDVKKEVAASALPQPT